MLYSTVLERCNDVVVVHYRVCGVQDWLCGTLDSGPVTRRAGAAQLLYSTHMSGQIPGTSSFVRS